MIFVGFVIGGLVLSFRKCVVYAVAGLNVRSFPVQVTRPITMSMVGTIATPEPEGPEGIAPVLESLLASSYP
jgi:hypothetical protein